MKENAHVEELKKYFRQEVEVMDIFKKVHKGQCRSINFQNLDVIIMDSKNKIIIRNPVYIKRRRDLGWSEKKE